MKIAKNCGIRIVLPAESTPRERFAAEELQKYIKSICSAALPIIADDTVPV